MGLLHPHNRDIDTPLVTREGALCRRCSGLDFQASFDSVHKKFECDFAIDAATSSSTCPLCSLTRRLVPEHRDVFLLFRGDDPSTEDVSMEIKKSHSGKTKLVCQWHGVYSFNMSPPLFDWPEDPKRVDFGPLKQKFAQCQTEHGPTCRVENRMLVEGLRVYNCLTNKLEKATTETKYVALSYVWGSFPDSPFQKPPEQRRTISDAMQVTLCLGYKYIWVDQLCINQRSTHKLQQIQQMDRIYQNADLTIVAAAGNDSDFGIPGVQDRSRLGRERFKIGDLQFVETLRPPHMLLRQTTWNTRAWTFQEEKLSHRLLVFTERAAWFSCYVTGAEEGFEAKSKEDETVHSVNLPLARKTPRPPCGLKTPHYFDDLMTEYSERSLTYPSDAVNAFSGILAVLMEAKLIVSHVWGTPVMPPVALRGSASAHDSGPRNVHTKRSTVDGFIAGLMWEPSEPEDLKPRHGIPSWSWAGWQGIIDFNELHHEENVNLGIEVSIECADGQVLTWSEFEGLSFLENQPHLISRFIHLKAWTMDVRLEYHRPPNSAMKRFDCMDETWRYAVMQTLNGDEFLSEAFILGEHRNPSTKEQLDESKCGVYIGVCLFPIDKTSRSAPYVMLLHKVNGSLQRIGYFMLNMSGLLRKRSSSGEVIYCDCGYGGENGELNIENCQDLGLKACMEEIRIG